MGEQASPAPDQPCHGLVRGVDGQLGERGKHGVCDCVGGCPQLGEELQGGVGADAGIEGVGGELK